MRLRGLCSCRGSLAADLDEQRLPEQGQRADAFDAPEARLDVQVRGGQPPLLLCREKGRREVMKVIERIQPSLRCRGKIHLSKRRALELRRCSWGVGWRTERAAAAREKPEPRTCAHLRSRAPLVNRE